MYMKKDEVTRDIKWKDELS